MITSCSVNNGVVSFYFDDKGIISAGDNPYFYNHEDEGNFNDLLTNSHGIFNQNILKINNTIIRKKSGRKMRAIGWRRKMGHGRSQTRFSADKGLRSKRPKFPPVFEEFAYDDKRYWWLEDEDELRLAEIENKSYNQLTAEDIEFLKGTV